MQRSQCLSRPTRPPRRFDFVPWLAGAAVLLMVALITAREIGHLIGHPLPRTILSFIAGAVWWIYWGSVMFFGGLVIRRWRNTYFRWRTVSTMAGGEAHYRRRVFLNVSEFCGLDFCGVGGIVPGQPAVEEMIIRDDGKGSIRLVTRDGMLTGACFLGDIRLADIARGLIAKQARLADLHSDHPLRRLLERGSP